MGWIDRILLLLTGAFAVYASYRLIALRLRTSQSRRADVYDIVAIVASLIPFSWATGVVTRAFPKAEKGYLSLLGTGLTIVFLPLLTMKRSSTNPIYLLVSLGGLLMTLAYGVGLLAGSKIDYSTQ
jgi:hypothetical protein